MYGKSPIKLFSFAVCFAVLSTASLVHAQTLTADDAATSGPGPGTSAGVAPTNASNASTTGALLRDGVFGCSASKYQNPGSLSAVGGVYVPVNDAAVTLNTGYLVYKECVLDGVVSAIKNDAVAGLQRQVVRAAENGRNGNAQYLKNFREDLRPRRNAIVLLNLSEESLSPMCGAYRRPVQSAIARGYLASESSPNAIYSCPFPATGGNQDAFLNNAGFTYGNWFAAINPSGNIYGATALADARLRSDIAEDDRNIREMLNWGRGVFSAFDGDENPLAQNVITPGYIIADSLSQMIGAGVNILLNANEIDQVNGALQAGLSSTIVTDAIRGLSGLTRAQNGQPSYVDRMASEASASVRTGAVNAAISILSPARQIETLYKQAKEAIAAALTAAITKLRAAETQCWELMVPKVQDYALRQNCSTDGSGSESCTPVPLDPKKIAASTSTPSFSQPIINTQIAPVASSTITDLRAAESALAQLNQLVTLVTNSSSAVNQRTALERLDSMVANNQLHSALDATNAQKQRDDVIAATTILVDDTLKAWGDSTDTNIGWCNINNTSAVDLWFNRWKL